MYVTSRLFKKNMDYIAGIETAADGLTKPLGREGHAKFVQLLGLVEG
jgi:hypothetical protein